MHLRLFCYQIHSATIRSSAWVRERVRFCIGKKHSAHFSLVCNFLFHIDLNGSGNTFGLCSLCCVLWLNWCVSATTFAYDVPQCTVGVNDFVTACTTMTAESRKKNITIESFYFKRCCWKSAYAHQFDFFCSNKNIHTKDWLNDHNQKFVNW